MVRSPWSRGPRSAPCPSRPQRHGVFALMNLCQFVKFVSDTVLSLARDFGIKAIVESVENKEEWNKVRELGASLGQGFFFFKPMATDELKEIFTGKVLAFEHL